MASLPLVGSFVNGANVSFFSAAGTAPLVSWASGFLNTTATSQLTWTQSSDLGFAYGDTAYFKTLYSSDTIDPFLNQINTNFTGSAITITAERVAFENQYAQLIAAGDTQTEAFGVVAATLTTALLGYTSADFGLTGADATAWNNQSAAALNRTSVSNFYAAASGSTTPSGAFLVPTATTGEPWQASQLVLTGVTADNGTVSVADNQISAALAKGDVTPIVGQGGGGQTYTLTTAPDNVIITQNNSTVIGTFNNPGATFTATDQISGGTFTGNTFFLSDNSTNFGFFNITGVPGVKVSGVQTVNINSSTDAIHGDFTATGFQGDWAGLTQLNVTDSSGASQVPVITIDPTTSLLLNDTVSGPATTSILTVNGGKVVDIVQDNSAFSTFGGGITVNGGTGTTDVSVVQSTAANSGDVIIQDAGWNGVLGGSNTQGTITHINLDGLDGGFAAATILDNALTDLTVVNSTVGGDVVSIINNFPATTATTLALHVNNNAFLTVDDSLFGVGGNNEIQTLNLSQGDKASILTFNDDGLLNVSLAGGAGAGKGILSAVFNDGVAGAVNFDFSATTVNGDSFVVNRTGVGGGGSAFADDTYALGNAGTVAKPQFLTIIGTGTESVAETIKFGSGLNSIFDVAHDNPTGHHYANTAATGLQSATIFSTILNTVTTPGNLDTLAFSTAPTSVAATPVLGFASVQAGIDFELGTLNLNQVGAFTVGAGTTTFVFDHAGGGAGAPLAAKDSLVAVDNFAAPLTSIGLNATTHDIQLIA